MRTPTSKTVALTGTETALAALATFGIEIINTSGNTLYYKLNGGSECSLYDGGTSFQPDITDASQVSVKGTGTLSYHVFIQ